MLQLYLNMCNFAALLTAFVSLAFRLTRGGES